MSLLALRDALPDYAIDLKHNLDRLNADASLSDQQKWGCYLACAFMLGVPEVLRTIAAETDGRLSDGAKRSAKAAAAIMGMNTTYYGAVNGLRNQDYRAASSQFSIGALTHPEVEKIDIELWALAVSAIANCSACMNTHEAELHKRGVALETIQAVLRIAALLNAISIVMRGEAAMASA